MCLLCIKKPQGVLLKREMREAFRCNSDGAGFMYVRDGKIIIDKGYFGFRSFYRAFRKAERENPDSHFMLHYRMATHGRKDALNCHPFEVNERVGFGHNGVMSELGNSLISDTADLCWSYFRKLPMDFLTKQKIKQIIERLAIYSGSKFAFLSADNTFHIANAESGHWSKDVWYSNYSYKLYGHVGVREWYGHGYRESWMEYTECASCGHFYKQGNMIQLGSKYYCMGCWSIIEAYRVITCPHCSLSTSVHASKRCDACGEEIEGNDIAFELSQADEYYKSLN